MEVRKRLGLRSLALLSIPLMAILVLVWGQVANPTVQASGAGPEMVMSVSGPGVTCSGGECDVPLGGDIMVSIDIIAAPSLGYIGVQTFIDYGTDLTLQPRAEAAEEFLWPDAGSDDVIVRGPAGTGTVSHGGLTGLIPPLPTTNYEGVLLELDLVCSDTFSRTPVRLHPFSPSRTGGAGFVRMDGPVQVQIPTKTDTVIVNCGEAPPPQATQPTSLPSTGTFGTGDGNSNGMWVLLGALLAAGVTGLTTFTLRGFSRRQVQ